MTGDFSALSANYCTKTRVNANLNSWFDELFFLNMDVREWYISDLDMDMIDHVFFEYMFYNPIVYGTTALNMSKADEMRWNKKTGKVS